MTACSSDCDAIQSARDLSLFFESSLDPTQQKRLGQYFTGLSLGRLLAALSINPSCRSVIDPMSGIGDLLDATLERCLRAGCELSRVDAIEIDQEVAAQCADRLAPWGKLQPSCEIAVHATSAFTPSLLRSLQPGGYDLVITNPPYVRYQTLAGNDGERAGQNPAAVRRNLLEIVRNLVPPLEQPVWTQFATAYSGHSDLSVPCWLLAGMLLKPGGTLAIVAPATWRSRNYASVLRYMLARCFTIRAIVADKQPGWFSHALVRTHLIVAQRLATDEVLVPLRSREPGNRSYPSVEIAPSAKKGESLLGNMFAEAVDPEGEFAAWLMSQSAGDLPSIPGAIVRRQNLDHDRESVLSQDVVATGLKRLEPTELPLFSTNPVSSRLIPAVLTELLPDLDESNLLELSSCGVSASQGLRTGYNPFFYVEFIEQVDPVHARVRVHRQLGGADLVVPNDVLKVVIRRQSDLKTFLAGDDVLGRVLDLRMYALPEDCVQVHEKQMQRTPSARQFYHPMSDALATLVRRAARTILDAVSGQRIPELSAVATNVRPTGGGSDGALPRFWYMLPDFTRRHTPDVFIARVNHLSPWAAVNRQPLAVIDANFATLWSEDEHWSPAAIAGFLNSAWARACMEAVGTSMGGGALKLEATHLRRLPIPRMSPATIQQIGVISQSAGVHSLTPGHEQDQIDLLISRALRPSVYDNDNHLQFIHHLRRIANTLQATRKRTAT